MLLAGNEGGLAASNTLKGPHARIRRTRADHLHWPRAPTVSTLADAKGRSAFGFRRGGNDGRAKPNEIVNGVP